jgi:hypothetical protein
VRSLGIDVVVVFTTFSVFSFSLKLFLPLVTDPEQERTSRECAAYISASRLQFKHYSPFKLIVQIIQVTLTFQPSPPDQVFWTKKRGILPTNHQPSRRPPNLCETDGGLIDRFRESI